VRSAHRVRRCAFCGGLGYTTEHVIPSCFYPASKARSRIQRITVLACGSCNAGWSDDEAHTKHVLLVAGESNTAVQELWPSAWRAMTSAPDGRRRLLDLVGQLVPTVIDRQERHVIYPGRDERVMRVIRKIVRGLCHHHGVATAIPDARVHAQVVDPPPPELLQGIELRHVERDIIEYWYDDRGEPPAIQSGSCVCSSAGTSSAWSWALRSADPARPTVPFDRPVAPLDLQPPPRRPAVVHAALVLGDLGPRGGTPALRPRAPVTMRRHGRESSPYFQPSASQKAAAANASGVAPSARNAAIRACLSSLPTQPRLIACPIQSASSQRRAHRS
jgi:hypothetical protein